MLRTLILQLEPATQSSVLPLIWVGSWMYKVRPRSDSAISRSEATGSFKSPRPKLRSPRMIVCELIFVLLRRRVEISLTKVGAGPGGL